MTLDEAMADVEVARAGMVKVRELYRVAQETENTLRRNFYEMERQLQATEARLAATLAEQRTTRGKPS